MLKKLLKYEFKATARTFGGLYLALVAVAALAGLVLRLSENGSVAMDSSAAVQISMIVLVTAYMALIVAVLVLTVTTIINRFYKNLLGGEGYLMNTLPVTSRQLILGKGIAALVWSLASMLAALLSISLMMLILSSGYGNVAWSDLLRVAQMSLREIKGAVGILLVELVLGLCALLKSIFCVYAACMIGHQFKRFQMPAGVIAYFVLSAVESTLTSLAGGALAGLLHLGSSAFGQGSALSGWVISVLTSGGSANLSAGPILLLGALPMALFAAVYFFLTDYLMRKHLNLE